MDKPTLEMTQIPVFRVHYKALEAFVRKIYDTIDFDFLLAAGVTEGIIPEYRINGKIGDTYEWERRATAIRNGKRISRYPDFVLNVLAADGYIPKGQYIIDTHKSPNLVEEYKRLLRYERNPFSKACKAFKEEHRRDKTFKARAILVDKAWLERHECDISSTPSSLKTAEPSI